MKLSVFPCEGYTHAMEPAPRFKKRYDLVTAEKAGGATYTPSALADFVAQRIVDAANLPKRGKALDILDPAVGEGELLTSLLSKLPPNQRVRVHGFDTDEVALGHALNRLRTQFPDASLDLKNGDFLRFVLDSEDAGAIGGLFDQRGGRQEFDLIIANPPYVRTQVMGAEQARKLAQQFGLTGRVDLYYAFILGMSRVLAPDGVAGIIVSNRFMTTKAGASVRAAICRDFNLNHVWDLGDTKLFDAAVLPAVILARGSDCSKESAIGFTSIYESKETPTVEAITPLDAVTQTGVVSVQDGRNFLVRHGRLETGDQADVWRVATAETDHWLSTVDRNTWRLFGEIGKIRVGVKTCADRVFIGTHWAEPGQEQRPELLRKLTTHHIGRRFRCLEGEGQRYILYPHESVEGKRRVVDLNKYPYSRAYLEEHRKVLEGRKYVVEAGREWYEVWVPQDPAAWDRPKVVFRDISEHPCFWLDLAGSVVNGDCYWAVCDRREDEEMLWMMVAVGNSTFIEAFYDHRFNNKLYAGRRRFITQYVEKFPLPSPQSKHGKKIVKLAKTAYESVDQSNIAEVERQLDQLVWRAFGLDVEEVAG